MVICTPTEAEWNAFVAERPDATCYHVYGWRRVFERAFNHETEYLAAKHEGRIAGVLPAVMFRSWLFGRFAVSLPFVNYGGILANDDDAVDALVRAGGEAAAERGCTHLELRHLARRCPDLAVKQHKVTMMLRLGADATSMWNALDRKVRNQVRKAQKSDLTTVVGGRELLDDFYGVFAVNMRDLGTPVYGRAFFDCVFSEFPDHTRVFLVKQGAVTVAAGIGLTFRDTIEVPWASSLKEYRALCPNNLLYWAIIEYAVSQGLTTLDFGRSTPGEGTYEFKRQWGAEPTPLFWEYELLNGNRMPDQSPHNPKYRQAIEMWKKLPVAVATAMGPHIVRSIP